MSLKTTPKPDGVKNPLFSVSAICQIWSVLTSHPSERDTPFANLSKDIGGELRLLEEPYSHIAGDCAKAIRISLLEELPIISLFIYVQVQVRMP